MSHLNRKCSSIMNRLQKNRSTMLRKANIQGMVTSTSVRKTIRRQLGLTVTDMDTMRSIEIKTCEKRTTFQKKIQTCPTSLP